MGQLVIAIKAKFNVDLGNVHLDLQSKDKKSHLEIFGNQSQLSKLNRHPKPHKSVQEYVNRLAYLKLKHYISDQVLQALLGTHTGVGELLEPGLRAYSVSERLKEIIRNILVEIPIESDTEQFSNQSAVNWATLSLPKLIEYLMNFPEFEALKTSDPEQLPFLRFSGDGRNSSNKTDFTLITVTIIPRVIWLPTHSGVLHLVCSKPKKI